MAFIDREAELAALEGRWVGGEAELVVVYGRRRVGKTALLREHARGKPHAYFLAARTREEDALRQLTLVLEEATADPVLGAQPFTSWRGVLAWLALRARQGRFLLVLDEFPNLCEATPELPSLLQAFWDSQGRSSDLQLVLCGSHVGFMIDEVLAERSPLFGRRTGQFLLGPLRPRDAGRFFPSAPPRDRLLAYGVAGGVPAYLERLVAGPTLEEAVQREAFKPSGFLFDEVNYLLRMELKEPATYMSLLLAIASGATRQTEIGDRARLPVMSVNRYLQTLVNLGLVERRVPLLDRAPDKSRKGLYVIADPFVRFWCRFVLPYQSLVVDGLGHEVWKRRVEPELPTFLGPVFEDACHAYVRASWASRTGRLPLRVGRHWQPGVEIDVLAELDDGTFLAGECKAQRKEIGPSVLAGLRAKVDGLPAGVRARTRLGLFSLSGFTAELRATAAGGGFDLVDGADVLGV